MGFPSGAKERTSTQLLNLRRRFIDSCNSVIEKFRSRSNNFRNSSNQVPRRHCLESSSSHLLALCFWADFLPRYGHPKGWQKWPAEGSHLSCLATPAESKLHFPKLLVNFQKMLTGSGWPGLGYETPAELIIMSTRGNGMSGLPLEFGVEAGGATSTGSACTKSGGGVAPQWKIQEGEQRLGRQERCPPQHG